MSDIPHARDDTGPVEKLDGSHWIESLTDGTQVLIRPLREEDRERSMLSMTRNEQISLEAMQEGMPWDWVSFGDFLDSVDRTPKGVNLISFAPLSPIMVWAMGGYDEAKSRRPNPEEIQRIKAVLHECMDAGAAGWSVQRLGEIGSSHRSSVSHAKSLPSSRYDQV